MFLTQFTGASFTWEQHKLGDLAESSIGGGTPKTSAKEYWGGTLPWIQSSDLIEDKLFNVDVKKHITNLGIKNSAAKLISQNSIAVVTRVGVGKLAFMPFEYATSQDFLSLSGIKGNPQFVTYTFQIAIKRLAHQLQGTSIKEITKSELLKVPIKVPLKKAEQDYISKLFFSLENSINLHERKIIQLKRMQKCIQQIITTFSGKNWEFIKLKNILKERKLLSTKSKNYPLVSFTVNDGVTPKTKRYEREQLVRGNVDNKKYKVTKLNDIVYNPANLKFGAIGRNKFGNAVFSPIYITFEAHDIDIIFLETLLTDPNFIKKSLKYQQGTVYERQSVSPKDLLNMKIIYPPYDLQLKFGHLFGSIQKKIDLEQRKLDQLIKFKNFLLQNMFI